MKKYGFLPSYFLTVYGIFVATTTLYLLRVSDWDFLTFLILVPALFFYPFLQILPAILLTLPAAKWSETMKRGSGWLVGSVLFLTIYPVHLFFLLNAGLFFRYGYHVNPHIVNLFTTPGGFESMGLRINEILMIAGGLLLLALLHGGLIFVFFRLPKFSFLKLKWWKYCFLPAIAGLLFLLSSMTYAYAHFMMRPGPLQTAHSIPFYIEMTSATFFKRLGMKPPERDAVILKLKKERHLEGYPQNPIQREPSPKYNVVWLACESWAARLYSPEVMPATAEFAGKGMTFRNHFSGGNVTRQGVFSMFYGLPGNYWHAFLGARRGPVLMDWMQADGYEFRCITSSKFTYPEFDQTVFAAVPSDRLHSDSKGETWKRDQRNLKLLLQSIRDGADSGKPFFSFMFFESSHHPYEFPPEAVYYKDYIDPFNAVQTTAADGEAIFRRAANTARHLDLLLAQVFALLEEKDLMKNTIVVLVGDHGEEYYEKGLLGHSSSFNREQTTTTLILYYPGIRPGIYEHMSSHLDIVPMLAPLFGVKNPPEDYCCGMNLLAPEAPRRNFAVIANWSQVFFAGEKYKSLIPLNAHDFALQTITDADDRPLDDVSLFYREYGKELVKLQDDLSRFTAED